MAVRAYAPASAGNISVGFDILGAAFAPVDGSPLGDFITVREGSSSFELICQGPFASKLPQDPRQNIVTTAWEDFCQEIARKGVSPRDLTMILDKRLPVGSGLGSSACSIVAALAALNAFHGSPLSQDELLRLMGKEEGRISGSIHYDNVAPCYLGGIQLMAEECGTISVTVPHFREWFWVSCYPGICVSTAEARKILPDSYDRHTCIDFGRQVALFVHASFSGNRRLASAVLRDVLAEPYRRSLIPGFDRAREASLKLGALAFGISGSGPSVFAVTPDQGTAEQVDRWLRSNFISNENGFSHICRIDGTGARVEEVQ